MIMAVRNWDMDEFIAGQLDGKTDMVTMLMMAGAALDLQNKVIIIISNNLKLTAIGTRTDGGSVALMYTLCFLTEHIQNLFCIFTYVCGGNA